MSDIIRVLRIIEYEGLRELVENQVTNSIHGTRVYTQRVRDTHGLVRITATTLGEFGQIISEARVTPVPEQLQELLEENDRLRKQLKKHYGETE